MSIALIHNNILACDDSQPLSVSPCRRFAVVAIGEQFDEMQLTVIWEVLNGRFQHGDNLSLNDAELNFLGHCEPGKSIRRRVLILTKVGAWVVTRWEGGVPKLLPLTDTSDHRVQGSGNIEALKFLDSKYDTLKVLQYVCLLRSRDCIGPGYYVSTDSLRDLTAHLVSDA